MAYLIEIRENDLKRVIAKQQISSDAGSLQRRTLAEKLVNKYSDPRDCYVVEYDLEDGSVLDIYDVVY